MKKVENASSKKEQVFGKPINVPLEGNPKEVFPVQGITWYYDQSELYHYIFIGSNFNPLNKIYEKIFIIHLSPTSARKFYEASADFFERVPEIENKDILIKLENYAEFLKSQLVTLSKSYISFHSNSLRISVIEGEGEVTCFYVDPASVRDFLNKGMKFKAEPVAKFTMGIESIVYFVSQIKRNKDHILGYKGHMMLEQGAI